MEEYDIEDAAISTADILGRVENYQWGIGKISNGIVERFGYKALPDFSKRIEEICGVRRTPGTLRMYAYIYKVSSKLGLPKDILFSACQAIVFSHDPKKYAEMAKQGLSGTEIRKAIYEEKIAQKD